MSLRIEHIYAQKSQLLFLALSAKQVEARFINHIDHQIKNHHIEGFEIRLEEQKLSGFFSKKIPMLHLISKKSALKQQEAYFFVSSNGNSFECTLYYMLHHKYIQAYKDKIQTQRIDFLQNSFSSFQERHDFHFFHALMTELFNSAVKALQDT